MKSVGLTERLSKFPALFQSAMKATSLGLRVAMPGIITKLDGNQTVEVLLTIQENVIKSYNNTVPTTIPPIPNVLLMVPSDVNFSITFPNLVGSEVLVIFADMCINGWWSTGQVATQERLRRHSLSDGFAILAPKSKGHVIPNYSTTNAEFKANNGHAKISIDASGNITVKGDTSLQLDTPNLEWINAIPPVASTYTNITNSIPIKINGVLYYIKLSTSP